MCLSSLVVPSSPPQNLTVEALDSRTVILKWNSPSIDQQNGIIREYLVKVTESESETEMLHQVPTNSLNITGLHPYYTYQIRIAAVTRAAGPFTETKTVRTLEYGKPILYGPYILSVCNYAPAIPETITNLNLLCRHTYMPVHVQTYT